MVVLFVVVVAVVNVLLIPRSVAVIVVNRNH